MQQLVTVSQQGRLSVKVATPLREKLSTENCKQVYSCCEAGCFNLEVYGDSLSLGASLKWP